MNLRSCGAILAFTSGEAIIQIARGAQLNAIGTFDKPIKFTSANEFDRLNVSGDAPRYADWGGIIVNGNGITNECTDAALRPLSPMAGISVTYSTDDSGKTLGKATVPGPIEQYLDKVRIMIS